MKFNVDEKVNTSRGPGTICDFSKQKYRVDRKDIYHVVLDGDTHHRAFSEDEIFRPVDEERKKEDIVRRLRSWNNQISSVRHSDMIEAADEIEMLRSGEKIENLHTKLEACGSAAHGEERAMNAKEGAPCWSHELQTVINLRKTHNAVIKAWTKLMPFDDPEAYEFSVSEQEMRTFHKAMKKLGL